MNKKEKQEKAIDDLRFFYQGEYITREMEESAQIILKMLEEKDKEIRNLKDEINEAWGEWNDLEQTAYEEETRLKTELAMDRIIKFRGKRKDNNKWIYGDLLQPTEFNNVYEISDNGCIDKTRYEVNPKTISQFTGLCDKNGREIYTSDIVKITEKEITSKHKIISMKPIIAGIAWSDEYLAYILITTSIKDAFENLGDYLDYDIEVIGNIWDNPELLEEGE